MKIIGLELVPVFATREMGRTSPSDPEKAVSEHVIVFLHTDAGITGLGEMSDINFSPTPKVLEALQTRLENLLILKSPFDLTAIHISLSQQKWEHQVVCGVDIALHDTMGKALDVPLYQLLGGKYRDRIPFSYPLAACRNRTDVEANLMRIHRLQEQGHRTIRYYFGVDLDLDELFLMKLRDKWGNAVEINALDASGRFDCETAIGVIERFAPFGPSLVESPIKGRHQANVEDFITVRKEVEIPIGEHVAEASVATRLARHNAVDVFNVGIGYEGITACRKAFGLAEMFGIKVLLGSTVELSIGTAARAHLISAMPNLDFPCYPSGPLVYQEKIVKESVRYESGYIIVPGGPGLGVEVDENRLKAQRIW